MVVVCFIRIMSNYWWYALFVRYYRFYWMVRARLYRVFTSLAFQFFRHLIALPAWGSSSIIWLTFIWVMCLLQRFYLYAPCDSSDRLPACSLPLFSSYFWNFPWGIVLFRDSMKLPRSSSLVPLQCAIILPQVAKIILLVSSMKLWVWSRITALVYVMEFQTLSWLSRTAQPWRQSGFPCSWEPFTWFWLGLWQLFQKSWRGSCCYRWGSGYVRITIY